MYRKVAEVPMYPKDETREERERREKEEYARAMARKKNLNVFGVLLVTLAPSAAVVALGSKADTLTSYQNTACIFAIIGTTLGLVLATSFKLEWIK